MLRALAALLVLVGMSALLVPASASSLGLPATVGLPAVALCPLPPTDGTAVGC